MSPLPDRVILIHGAWQGAWAWGALLPELARLGIDARALELPGNGHHPLPAAAVTQSAYHATLAQAMDDAPGRVVLVGHSGGGQLVTYGAEAWPERVKAAVYVAGFLLPEGRSFGVVQQAIAPEAGQFGVTPHIVYAPDSLTCSVPAAAAIRFFYHDAPPEVAAAAAAQLTPQPMVGHRLTVPTTPTCFGSVPKVYIEALHDRSIPLAAQRLMQGFVPGLRVIAMTTGHAPALVDPVGLAGHLAAIAAE